MNELPFGTTPVRLKFNPSVTGCFIYGHLETRRAAGIKEVLVYFTLDNNGTTRSSYKMEDVEEVTP